VPGVIWDIQRVGPSTGLPTRTSQGDILSTAFLSHGDTKNILLLPCSVAECFDMATDAFNLAEKFQTLVFVMSDLDLGMNNWMSDPFKYPETPINRGKVLGKEDLEKLGDSRATKTWTAMASATAPCPGPSIRQRPTLRGAADTMKSRSTASVPTTSNATWSGSIASSRRRAHSSRVRKLSRRARRSAIIAYGTSHWALVESLDQLHKEYQFDATTCGCARIIHARGARVH